MMKGRKQFTRNQRRGFWAGGLMLALILGWLGLRNYRPAFASYAQQGVEVDASNGPVDWPKVKASGASFAYLVATASDDGQDERFAENWRATAAAGLNRGAIHRFHLCRLANDQAGNFIATVPRGSSELPAALDLDMELGCASIPAREVILQEVAAFIRMVEAHTEKPMIVRVSRDFENRFTLTRAIDRPLWLSSFLLVPSYGERPWVMWRANGKRHVSGVPGTAGWSVVRP